MKKTFIIIVALVISTMSTSCTKDESEFEGSWSGTYSGNEDSGTWQADVFPDGSLNGTFTSTVSNNLAFDLNGNVDSNGNLESTFGGSVVTGELMGVLTGDMASGTWVNLTQDIHGTWQGTRD